jgi:dTDP-glucose 4,6-dehydratase
MIGEVDLIWHLAAESHVDRSLEDSIPFVMSNVVGTANLLEYVKEKQPNLRKFVYFSTDEVFGPAPLGTFYSEDATNNPSNPYSASKEGAEALCKAFAFSFKLPIMITRTMNVFGERQHPEKFVPMTCKKMLRGDSMTLHGLPGKLSSRCWIHARNVCKALQYLMAYGEIIKKEFQDDPGHGCYHIVGEERNVKELADRIAKIVGITPQYEYIDFHKTRPGHDLRYALAGDKLKKLGFEYPLTLEQSFDKMIKWMVDDKHKHWLNI